MSEDTSRIALERCRFCSGTFSGAERDPIDNHRWRVFCMEDECGAQGPSRATKREAIAAWNTRARPVVKALVFDKYGEAKAGGAKYCIYEAGSQGLWNCVCYPHEDVQYRIAESVSRDEAVRLANEDQTRRVHVCLEGYDD